MKHYYAFRYADLRKWKWLNGNVAGKLYAFKTKSERDEFVHKPNYIGSRLTACDSVTVKQGIKMLGNAEFSHQRYYAIFELKLRFKSTI